MVSFLLDQFFYTTSWDSTLLTNSGVPVALKGGVRLVVR